MKEWGTWGQRGTSEKWLEVGMARGVLRTAMLSIIILWSHALKCRIAKFIPPLPLHPREMQAQPYYLEWWRWSWGGFLTFLSCVRASQCLQQSKKFEESFWSLAGRC